MSRHAAVLLRLGHARVVTPRRVGLAQGLYYLVSGLWPLVSLRTFERVTGPKTDDWLVRTVGALAATIGGVLVLRSLVPRSPADPDGVLGAASAATFAAVDTVYATRGRISPVYLGDAAVELGLVAAWAAARRRAG